jgi:hypothetical protein
MSSPIALVPHTDDSASDATTGEGAEQSVAPPEQPSPRNLSATERTEREVAGRMFGRAMQGAKCSDGMIAKAWGAASLKGTLSANQVAKVREGEKPLTAEKLLILAKNKRTRGVAARFADALAAVSDGADADEVPLRERLSLLAEELGATFAEERRAMADKKIDDAERAALEEHFLRILNIAQKGLANLRSGK